MKKLLLTIFGLLSIGGVTIAGNISQIDIPNLTNQCNPAQSKTLNYYIKNNNTTHPYDRFWNNSVDSIINASNSQVEIWRNGVIVGCSDWTRMSNIVKKEDTLGALILQNQDGCTFTTPNYLKVGNNADKIDAQIRYTVGYNQVGTWINTAITAKFYYKHYDETNWTCYPGGQTVSNTSSCTPETIYYKKAVKYHTGECLNYRVFRCGDGLVNGYNGSTAYDNDKNSNGVYLHSYTEQCDPNDPTHAGWNNNEYTCNASCQLVISTPVGQPDLTIDKEQITTGTMEAGSTVAYKITVKNEGSGTATGVIIYDLLPEQLQYMTSSINITPSSTYLFTTGTILSRTYIKYSNITLAANGTAIVYLTGKVKDGYTFNTLKNCASVSGSNIPVEEDCEEVTPPTPPAPTTCTISLSARQINLGESITVNYQISGVFNNPTYMEISPSLTQGAFPYTIDCNTANNCQFTQGNTTIAGTSIPGTGIYTLWISGYSINGDFYCSERFSVKDGTNPPNTGHGNVSIEKVLESVGPFSVGDKIRYKIVAENHGDATVITPIIDMMPDAVTYLTSSIMFIPNTQSQHYTFSTGILNGRFMFKYDNVAIAPGQKVIIYLTGVINNNYIDQGTLENFLATNKNLDCLSGWTNKVIADNRESLTTNCVFTYTDNTGANGSGHLTGSCVEIPTPTMIKYQSVRDIEFTRDEVEVAPSEIITYKVVFGNEKGEIMKNVTLRDDMPACVDYISSQVYGISGYTFSTGMSNGSIVVSYAGFTLGSGQYGYLIVTGRISDSPACENVKNYKNIARMIYDGGYLRSDVIAKRPGVLLTKTGDGPQYNLSQPNTFYITVTNNSTGTIYDIVLSEVESWPTFNDCVNYIDWRGSNFTKDQNELFWRYNGNLQPGESIGLIISGSIGSGASCVRDYINTVVLTYKDVAGNSYKLNAKYPFYVTSGESAVLEKTVDEHKVSINDIVTYTIIYRNVGNVDRKTGYTLTDKWPSDVLTYVSSNCSSIATCTETRDGNDIVFTFNSALHPGEGGTLILTGKVKTSRSDYKWNTVILDYSTIFDTVRLDDDDYIEYEEDPDQNCGNGILESNEKCDGGYDRSDREEGDRFYIINYLDYNRTTQADDNIAGKGYYCTKSCELRKTSDSSYSIPSCLNVDTTISIMENEIFPFWWRIWQRDGIRMVHGGSSKSCNNYSTANDTVINKDTMTCSFAVYDGKSYNQANKKPLYTFDMDCFIDKNSDDDIYFVPFDNNTCAFSWCVDFDKVAGRQAINLQSLLGSKWNKDTYGEYKLALEHVKYQYCEDGTWKDGALYDAVCEVNFVLTKPYIMQVNTAGVPKATSSTFLNRFYDIAGHKIETDINNIVKVSESSYNMTQNVKSQISQFKNKYEKLAVAITNNWGGGVSSVKKVPKQSIYFVKGNGTLKLSKSDSMVSNAFTIVVDGMDVEIDGSILTNGMIITDQTISFKDSDCTSGGQVVQGIFIASGGFLKNESTLNQKTNRPRCHWGNLHVKGVLIGKNINNITNSKRSQLNSWFETELEYANTNDAQLKKERRNKIFQGASVLIEYNSDVWNKSIPGAEIFTETLDVYKK